MSRTRDSQRSKVYAAQRVLRPFSRNTMTFAECEQYLARVMASRWFRNRYGDHYAVSLIDRGDRGGSATSWGSAKGHINLPSWARCEWVLLHELAHNVTTFRWGYQSAGHGWQFCSVYLDLVRHFLGAEAHDALKTSFDGNKVRYRQPRTRTLTDDQRAAAAERLAAWREAQGPRFSWTCTEKDERGWRTHRWALVRIEVTIRDEDGNLVECNDDFNKVTKAREWARRQVDALSALGGTYAVVISGNVDSVWDDGERSERWEGRWIGRPVEDAA